MTQRSIPRPSLPSSSTNGKPMEIPREVSPVSLKGHYADLRTEAAWIEEHPVNANKYDPAWESFPVKLPYPRPQGATIDKPSHLQRIVVEWGPELRRSASPEPLSIVHAIHHLTVQTRTHGLL